GQVGLRRRCRGCQRAPAWPAHSTSEVLQCQVDQFLLELRVRGIKKLNETPARRLLEDAAGVGEGLEAEAAVAFADAAVADAAERQGEVVEVRQRVVDGGAAGAGAAEDVALHAAVVAEEVERQRLLALADDAQRVVERPVRQPRQGGGEESLPEHGGDLR